mmetsp:Transcript_6365/g.7709  ORF Transcript_6365/g.7709 Transcript_6365/m.7709 type:complete len:125 (-) Transcript_6365:188-562(-)
MGSEEYLKTDLGSGLCMSSTWKEVNQGQAQLPEKNEPDLSTLKQIFKLGANEKEDKQTKAYCLLLKPENIGAACPCDVIICPPESKHIQIKCLFVRSTAVSLLLLEAPLSLSVAFHKYPILVHA